MPEDLIGWRTWRLFSSHDEGAVLVSAVRDEAWLAPVHHATRAPLPDGRDGIHAVYTQEAIGAYAAFRSNYVVYGQITVSGLICHHQLGLRAATARIDALYLKTCSAHSVLPPPGSDRSCYGRGAGPRFADFSASGVYCRCGNGPVDESVIESARRDLEQRYQCDVFRVAASQRGGQTCDTWRRYGLRRPGHEDTRRSGPHRRESTQARAEVFSLKRTWQ